MKTRHVVFLLMAGLMGYGCGASRATVKASAPVPTGADVQIKAFAGMGQVSSAARGFKLVVESDGLFKKGSSRLSKEGVSKIDGLAATLSQYPGDSVTIAVYTDSSGSDAKNLKISKRRAEHLKAELVKKGVPAAQLTALGKGSADPVASNDTPENQAKNRRVEFIVALK